MAAHLGWPLFSDIDPLLALKELHRDRENTSLPRAGLHYWPEFGAADSTTTLAMFERFQLTLREDGFEIDKPEVWDEALSRCVSGATDGPCLIEFARGRDRQYLDRFGIAEQDVYARAFRALPIKPTDSVLVIELFCSLTVSLDRNRKRIEAGERGVSDRSMSRVYSVNPLEKGGREKAQDVLSALTANGWSEYRVVYNDGSVIDLMATLGEILEGNTFCATD